MEMECKNCHSTWKPSKNALKTLTICPFCGESLADAEKEKPAIFDNFREALAFIMSRHGVDVLLGSMLKNFLLDYAPEIAALRKNVVFSVFSSGAADILKKIWPQEQVSRKLHSGRQ